MRLTSPAFVAFALLLTSCQSDATAVRRVADAQLVARGIALALSDATVRNDLRDVMRASPLVTHRIGLQAYLRTARGKHMLSVATQRLGVSTDELGGAIAALRSMDLSLPRRDDRRTWQATADLFVAATVDNDVVPAFVFEASGDSTPYRKDLVGALFLLEPTESRNLRINPQPTVHGAVVQDSIDGEGGGNFQLFDKKGRLVYSVQLADLYAQQQLSSRGDVAFAYGSAADSTRLASFWTDAQDGIGSMEIRFTSLFYDANNEYVYSGVWNKDEIDSDFTYTWNVGLIAARPEDNTIARIKLTIVEQDEWHDDNMGTRDFTWSDNNQTRTLQGSGDNSNVKLAWTALSGPTGTNYVNINGPSQAQPSNQCHWYVSTNVSSPNVAWYNGETEIGTGEDLYYSVAGTFTLTVLVWNSSTGAGADNETTISVSSQHSQCLDQ